MSLNLNGLKVLHPFDFLFQEQKDHIEYLNKQILNQRLIATETQRSTSKTILLFCYFLAYFQQQAAAQFQQLIFLVKCKQQVASTQQAIYVAAKHREKVLGRPPRVNIKVFDPNSTSLQHETFPMIMLATLKDFLGVAVSQPLYQETVRSIVYVSQCDTLDLECEDVLNKEVNFQMIYLAMKELEYIKNTYVGKENSEEELKQIAMKLKDMNFVEDPLSFMESDSKLIGLIQYLLNFLKVQQKTMDRKKIPSKKISEFKTQILNLLFLKPNIVLNVNKYFKAFLRRKCINPYIARRCLMVCSFFEILMLVQNLQQEHKNAFRVFANFKTDYQSYVYRLMCLDPKIMFSKLYPYSSKPQKGQKGSSSEVPSKNSVTDRRVLLVINTYTTLQKDFFYSNFKISLNVKTFVSQIPKNNLLALSVICDSFEVDLKSDDYESENKLRIQRSYGTLLEEISNHISDGVVVYVSSMRYLHTLLKQWESEGILMKLKSNKPVFVEESNEQNNKLNISKFQMSCNVGRGGIFFMNVRSRCAEMAEFHGHYSNLVVFMGYPVLSIRDEHIKEKLDYINEKQKSKDYDYLEQDALRHVNACLSNFCGNSKFQRKIILFADARYSMSMIPPWMSVSEGNLNISESIDNSILFQRSINDKELNISIKERSASRNDYLKFH